MKKKHIISKIKKLLQSFDGEETWQEFKLGKKHYDVNAYRRDLRDDYGGSGPKIRVTIYGTDTVVRETNIDDVIGEYMIDNSESFKPIEEVKYISAKKFREEGFLQEVNRQFLHPLGLALTTEGVP